VADEIWDEGNAVRIGTITGLKLDAGQATFHVERSFADLEADALGDFVLRAGGRVIPITITALNPTTLQVWARASAMALG
jgi:hypothetical protein